MKNHNGSALLIVLIIMTLLITWAGYQWRSIAYLADIAFKKQEYYQHYYETLGILHVAQCLVQDNEVQIKKMSHARKALIIPFIMPSLHKGQRDASLLVYITKKNDGFNLLATHGTKAESSCCVHCLISKQKESERVNQKDQYKIEGWSAKIK